MTARSLSAIFLFAGCTPSSAECDVGRWSVERTSLEVVDGTPTDEGRAAEEAAWGLSGVLVGQVGTYSLDVGEVYGIGAF